MRVRAVERLASGLDRVSDSRYAPWAVFLIGFIVAALFAFFLFPRVQGPFALGIDSDRYGDLARSLWEYGTMSYYPLDQPSIDRGPLYPWIAALTLALTGGAFPWPVQFIQCLLLGLTAFLVWWMAGQLFDSRAGLLAGLACAVNPLLFWYSPRIWVDVTLVFQFTLMAALQISYLERPAFFKALLTGLVIGLGALSKSILLPFAVLVPLGLHLTGGKRVPLAHTLALAVVALGLVAPWTIRNYNLTGHLIPVHVMPFYTVYQGDSSVRRFWDHPFSINELQRIDHDELNRMIGPLKKEFPHMTAWRIEYELSNRFMEQSLEVYKNNPLLMVKKILIHAYIFWFVGADPWKTAAISALMLPLLILFGRSMYKRLRACGLRGVEGLHLGLVVIYYGAHLPLVGYIRLATALIPLIMVYGAGNFARQGPAGDLAKSPKVA